jgi:hypothetical protein
MVNIIHKYKEKPNQKFFKIKYSILFNMQLDVLISLVIGVGLITVLIILYALGDVPKLKTLGRILTVLGGVSAFAGAILM